MSHNKPKSWFSVCENKYFIIGQFFHAESYDRLKIFALVFLDILQNFLQFELDILT